MYFHIYATPLNHTYGASNFRRQRGTHEGQLDVIFRG